MPSEVKDREFDPLLDRTGRPWRVDSNLACGMPVGAFMWISHCKSVAKQITCTFNGMLMRAASFVPDSTRSSIQSDGKPRKSAWHDKHISDSEIAMMVDLYTLGARGRLALLPLRNLEVSRTPAAILQIRKVSLAAVRVARWRQWFGALDEAQQKAHLQNVSKTGNDISWAGLWLEYEERPKQGHTRLVATAVRAVAFLGLQITRIMRSEYHQEALKSRKKRDAERNRKPEVPKLANEKPGSLPVAHAGPTAVRAVAFQDSQIARILMSEYDQEALKSGNKRDAERNRKPEVLKLANEKRGSLPVAHAGPSSAPLTPHDIKMLKLRPVPCYFCLPAHAFRFATQIFSGKSYEEAVKEQKANFNSWVREANVCRVVDRPDLVVRDGVVVPEDQVCTVDVQDEEEEPEKPNAIREAKVLDQAMRLN